MKINLTKLLEISSRVKLLSEIPLTGTPVEIDYETTGKKEPYSFELALSCGLPEIKGAVRNP